jgi:glutamate racemase
MIGVFDSGLGGLITLKSLIEPLPQYDYFYFGDTANLPYGNKSKKIIYELTEKAVDFLFSQGCYLIILACHTASTQALRRIQREYLIKNYPQRRVLGVTVPLREAGSDGLTSNSRVGILATRATCSSFSFEREFEKIDSGIKAFCQPAPLLVPIIEEGKLDWPGLDLCLEEYLEPLLKQNISKLILGCTHYSLVKERIRNMVGKEIEVVCSDEILPAKLKDYLKRHPEIETNISQKRKRTYCVSDLTPYFKKISHLFWGGEIDIKTVSI